MAKSSLSAIKSTEIDTETANINLKNNCLSIMLTGMDEELQKSLKKWYYSALDWHLGNMMVGTITF